MNDLFSPDGGDVEVAGQRIARGELWRRAACVAAEVRGAPIVTIDATATLDTVVRVVGCLEAGVPFVPIAPDSGPLERDHIWRDAHAHATPSGAACVMYTSGTTGLPKGVVLSRDALAGDLDALADAWGWTADDTLVHGLPLFHVHGLILGVLGALRVGSALVHTGRPDPVAYAAAKGSLYFGVPTVWSRVAADEAVARARCEVRASSSPAAPACRSRQPRRYKPCAATCPSSVTA